MARFGDQRLWDNQIWKQKTFVTHLHQLYRCIDKQYWNLWEGIDAAKPAGHLSTDLQHNLLWYQNAWGPDHFPKRNDIARIWHEHPHTTMLAFTHAGANLIDDFSVEASYRKKQPLAT
eukprot:2014890-Karenia_brevis.AAC.1